MPQQSQILKELIAIWELLMKVEMIFLLFVKISRNVQDVFKDERRFPNVVTLQFCEDTCDVEA